MKHLEYLSDKRVLSHLSGGLHYLEKNNVKDVALYMNALASLLE